MLLKVNILSEITNYIEKLPQERQLEILNDLKREKIKTAKPTQKDILELSAEINKNAFKKVKSRYI
jgi:hypothetical protein